MYVCVCVCVTTRLLPLSAHLFISSRHVLVQQQRVLQRSHQSRYFRGDARERDVRRDAGEPVDEEQRRDPEEESRNQTLHHQPEGCGEVHQIRGHGPEPSVHPGEPQVNTPTQWSCCWMMMLLLLSLLPVGQRWSGNFSTPHVHNHCDIVSLVSFIYMVVFPVLCVHSGNVLGI